MRQRQPRGVPRQNLQRTFVSRRTRRHDLLLEKLLENSPGTLFERLGLEILTRDAARVLNREKHEQAWKAKNDTLTDAPLHLVTNRVTKNGQVERDTIESVW
jgi:hypothetical protein